jgi:hypothetical protein
MSAPCRLCYREKMPTPDDIPENVDLEWIARHLLAIVRHLVAMRGSITALERGQESLRDDVGIMAAILRRVDHNQTAYRDELRQLYEMHRDLRERVETIERRPPAR